MAPNNGSGDRRPTTARRSPGVQRPSSSNRSSVRVGRQGERPASRRPGDYTEDIPVQRKRRPAREEIPTGGSYDEMGRVRRPSDSARSRAEGARSGQIRSSERPEGSVRRQGGSSERPEGSVRRHSGSSERPEGSVRRQARPVDRSEGSARRQSAPASRPAPRASAPSRKERAKKKSRKTMILFALEVVIILGLLGFIYFVRQTSRVEKIRINEEAITIEMNQNVTTNETMKGYRNIAMFGVDSREGTLGKGTRSDTIIIASINQDTGDVKLLSVFRDTYLNLGNDTYNKCNAAYAQGGPEQAVIMLNKNLDMDITDYITVGFDGLIEVVDALGGVEIEVTQAEISHLNNYQISMVGTTTDGINFTANAGTDYTPVTSPGKQKLNGLQATAYCRIRYIGNDFQRAQRQRDVIQAISLEAKKASVAQLNGVVTGVMDNVSTSLDVKEILEVASDLARYNIVANDGFPFEENRDTGRVGAKGDCVIPVDLKANVVEAHDFFFNEKDYQVSPEVEAFSEKVAADTGKRK